MHYLLTIDFWGLIAALIAAAVVSLRIGAWHR